MWHRWEPAPHEASRTSEEWRRKARIARRQLEVADLYLAAVENLEFPDPDLEHGVRDLRSGVARLRLTLSAPRLWRS